MHKRNIVHRDLKPENILFLSKNDDSEIKVCDFGLGAIVSPGEKLTFNVGTQYYIAPEIFDDKYNEKCDVWSAGIILYCMLSGFYYYLFFYFF